MSDKKSKFCELYRSSLPGCAEVGWAHWKRSAFQDIHHHHGLVEFHIFTRSAQRFYVDGVIRDVPANHGFVVGPGVPHGPASGALHTGECYWLRMDIQNEAFCPELNEVDRQHIREDIRRCIRAGVFLLDHETVDSMKKLVKQHKNTGVHAIHLAHAALIEVISGFCMALRYVESREPEPIYSGPIQDAIAAMREMTYEPVSLDKLADEMGVTTRTFHKRFVKETGFTPGQYRMRCRLDRTRDLLDESSFNITEIAMQAGFPSSQYFSTVFRKHYGCSPNDYRQQHRSV